MFKKRLSRGVAVIAFAGALMLVAVVCSAAPSIEDYATIEAYTGDVPVYAFGYTYVYGLSPDLLPGVVVQEGNTNPVVKLKPKKSWEIKSNFCGSTPAREPKTSWNDDQPLLPVHLIDGDPETAWSSRGGTVPNRQPEWIRIDLPMESTVASVSLVCSRVGPSVGGKLKVGKVLPGELSVKVSRDARQWETVYESKEFQGTDSGPNVVRFEPRPAKQIWIIANNLQGLPWGHAISIGEVEVSSDQGQNLALVSRGAGVQVSSTYYGYGMDRFTQDMLWPIQYDLGFKWTRVGYDLGMFLWSYVEREKGKLVMDPKADAAITEAHKNGINVILCLDKGNWLYRNPPKKVDWKKARVREMMDTYHDHPGWPAQSKQMMAGYLKYVDYMVRHFKGRVAYYEICNEWTGIKDDYCNRLLPEAIRAIKKADPDARIMLGSVMRPEPVGGVYAEPILTCLKLPGVASQIDAVGWHAFYHVDPDHPKVREYGRDVERFKMDCAALGFKGQYAATEWTYVAPYPGHSETYSEMQKAKYSARLMTAHSGMGIISLYNETFQTGKIDWDCTLLRNAFSTDPISPAQPQPIYYVFRNISTALDGFEPADFQVDFTGEKKFDCYTFKRGGELMFAAWIPGRTTDGIVEAKTDITLPGLRAGRAWAVDLFNGTEQELIVSTQGADTVLRGVLVKDYPVLVRLKK